MSGIGIRPGVSRTTKKVNSEWGTCAGENFVEF